MEFEHIPVLLDEVIEGLNIKPDGIYVDGTLGGAGHSYEIAKRLSDKGRLIGIDQDEDAIKAASERLKEFGNRVTIIRDNYSNMPAVLKELGIERVDGVLLDIGVSSYQLDNPERGFTYREDAPLDMRMDKRSSFSAKELVNEYSREDLIRVLRDYGEERNAARIADSIIRTRADHPIETTGELAKIVEGSIPAKFRYNGGHPAKQTFQAIRIEVNGELTVLEESIDAIIDLLTGSGRLCIITFHSLEDRIVKSRFKGNVDRCICPPQFPVCTCGRKPKGRLITSKPIVPSDEEIDRNRRAKSSKLRIFERIRNDEGDISDV